MAWYVFQKWGKKASLASERLLMKKNLLKGVIRGDDNLHLTVARVGEKEVMIPPHHEEEMDPGLWGGLPSALVCKIFVDHLPPDFLPALAHGSHQLTTSLVLNRKCVMLVHQNLILHNFGSRKKTERLPDGSRLLALSSQGLLFVFCEKSGRLLAYNLAEGQNLDLEWSGKVAIDAGQVIHPNPSKPDEYKLVILYSTWCPKASVYDSCSRSWSRLRTREIPESPIFSSFSAIGSSESEVEVIIPRQLYCHAPLPRVTSQDYEYTLILATLGRKPGDHIWERDPFYAAKHGIDEKCPVVIGAVRLSLASRNWEIAPGPSRECCKGMALAELSCLGVVADCLVVFGDTQGHLLSCLVEPWSWWSSKPVISWCSNTNNGDITYALFA